MEDINTVNNIKDSFIAFITYFKGIVLIKERHTINYLDIFVLLSLIIFVVIFFSNREKLKRLFTNRPTMSLIFNRMFIIFPIFAVLFFLVGLLWYKNLYVYLYWCSLFSISLITISLILSKKSRERISTLYKVYLEIDSSPDGTETDKKVSIIRLFLVTFLQSIIFILTIVVLFLIWTIPYNLLQNILMNFKLDYTLFYTKLIRIAINTLVTILIIRIFSYAAKSILKITESFSERTSTVYEERRKRVKTVVNITENILKTLVVAIYIIGILQEIGINLTALFAGAGILGIAIGFGTQSLVKDFLSGLFILMENQYKIGDVINVSGVSGTVEKITLRTTVLRNLEGMVHTIPNGNIMLVSNMTHELSKAVIDINIDYNEDIDKVIRVLDGVLTEFNNEPYWGSLLKEKPVILGVNELGTSSVVMRIVITTNPGKQWEAKRELNKRIKIKFFDVDIDIPYQYINVVEYKKNRKRESAKEEAPNSSQDNFDY